MTSVTEILRRMLDERGVEWEDMSALGYLATLWHGDDAACTALEGADDIPHGKVSVQACLTPEQAVEATLGRGTCEVEGFDDGMDEGMDGEWFAYAPPTWYLSCSHEAYGQRPCYCPVCGRKVVK